MNAYGFLEILQNNKYTQFESGMNDVYLCGIKHDGQMQYVAIVDDTVTNPVTSIRVQDAMYDIRSKFATKNLLVIVFSWDTDRVKEELGELYGYWMYNIRDARLMIYEDQPQHYLNIESLLTYDEEKENAAYRKRAVYRRTSRIAIVNYSLVAINIIVFMITALQGNVESAAYLAGKGGMVPYLVTEKHEYYRLFTSMFLHGSLSHIFSNMLALTFIGDNLERAVGKVKYLIIYMVSGLGGSLAALFYYSSSNALVCCVGASGAIFGVLGALVYILIVNKGQLEDLTLGRMLLYIGFSIYIGISSEGTCNAAHIGGLLVGFVMAAILYRKKGNSGL